MRAGPSSVAPAASRRLGAVCQRTAAGDPTGRHYVTPHSSGGAVRQPNLSPAPPAHNAASRHFVPRSPLREPSRGVSGRTGDPSAPERRTLIARAPARLDFGGGWTDVPPYADERGGFVCNVAITRHATAVLRSGAPVDSHVAAHDSALARAALHRAAIGRASDNRAAPTLTLAADFPVGAGLGGSSAAGVAAVGALAAWRGEAPSPQTLAERSRAIEVEELGIAGGWQDHLAAAHGGALGIDFGGRIAVRRLAVSAATRDALPACALVVYTGQSRISATTITAVLDAYRDRVPEVVDALAHIATLARAMAIALEDGDLPALGALVGEHWHHQRRLHPAITTPQIDAIVARAAASGAWGTKALGASGGGSVLVMGPPERRADLVAALDGLGELVPWSVDVQGFTVVDDHTLPLPPDR